MRIFFASIGVRQPDGQPALWGVNLLDPLLEMGHDVVESQLDWDDTMRHLHDSHWLEIHRPSASQQLLDEVRSAHREKPIDLFFSYFYSGHVEPGVIQQISALGIPTANFYCNAAHQFHLVKEIAPAYDFCWVPERIALPYYKAAGANAVHIQMGASPAFYRPMPEIQRDVPISFGGMLYADRPQWLAAIIKRGVDIQIFTKAAPNEQQSANAASSAPKRSYVSEILEDLTSERGVAYTARRILRYGLHRQCHPVLKNSLRAPQWNEAMVRLFARSHGVLNLSHVFDGGIPGGRIKAHVRLRDFEAPLCRVLFFPQWCDEIEEYYEPDKEVVAWKTVDEVCEKIRFYLSHPAEADRLREASYRRALNEHTSQKRFEKLFTVMGLDRVAVA